MERWICKTCGTQFTAQTDKPDRCPICLDERQFVGPEGQDWTTLSEMKAKGYSNQFQQPEPGLTSIRTTPTFAIGQRALLLQTPVGNVLWDCITLLDDATVAAVKRLGGIQAIAISHPHYYSAMAEWAEGFGAPVYLHEADQQWVMGPRDHVRFWTGEQYPLMDGVTLVHVGGHFTGSSVLYFAGGADGKGVLLTGDTVQVCSDPNQVSFMYSYPNYLPLPTREVERIGQVLARYPFERIYGFQPERVVPQNASAVVSRSVARYLQALS